jgi:hypothetical protein
MIDTYLKQAQPQCSAGGLESWCLFARDSTFVVLRTCIRLIPPPGLKGAHLVHDNVLN